MFEENVLFALILTIFAGLSTGIGSLMAFFSRRFNTSFLCAALGFSAGVMIYVSFVEILGKGRNLLMAANGEQTGQLVTVIAFFGGIALIAIIDRLVPSHDNPHEIKNIETENYGNSIIEKKKLLRMGLFSAVVIGIHNFPEGLATFMGALSDPALGISIAVAIAIHNIPEGIAVSMPIYYATKSRKKAFWLSFSSGLAEPIGAIAGYFLLRSYFNETVLGVLFAAVAGIMVYISLDELLPTAEEYGKHHTVIGGVIAGMALMALSLLLFI